MSYLRRVSVGIGHEKGKMWAELDGTEASMFLHVKYHSYGISLSLKRAEQCVCTVDSRTEDGRQAPHISTHRSVGMGRAAASGLVTGGWRIAFSCSMWNVVSSYEEGQMWNGFRMYKENERCGRVSAKNLWGRTLTLHLVLGSGWRGGVWCAEEPPAGNAPLGQKKAWLAKQISSFIYIFVTCQKHTLFLPAVSPRGVPLRVAFNERSSAMCSPSSRQSWGVRWGFVARRGDWWRLTASHISAAVLAWCGPNFLLALVNTVLPLLSPSQRKGLT